MSEILAAEEARQEAMGIAHAVYCRDLNCHDDPSPDVEQAIRRAQDEAVVEVLRKYARLIDGGTEYDMVPLQLQLRDELRAAEARLASQRPEGVEST